jgi:hypothetical protein
VELHPGIRTIFRMWIQPTKKILQSGLDYGHCPFLIKQEAGMASAAASSQSVRSKHSKHRGRPLR